MPPTTSLERVTTSASAGHVGVRRADLGRRIEKAALALFLQHHPDEVTADEIAKAAGTSRRTFFRYFASREDVLTAMPTRSLMQALAAVRARPAEETLVEALLASARTPTADDAEIARLSEAVMVRYPEVWSRALGRLHRGTSPLFAEMVAHRLRLAGKSDEHSGPIGAAMAAVVVHTYIEVVNRGGSSDLNKALRDAFAATGAALLATDAQ